MRYPTINIPFVGFFLICLFFTNPFFSQDSLVINGVIIEKVDKKPIPNARVEVLVDSTIHSAFSSFSGRFSLTVPRVQSYTLLVKHPVFTETEQELKLSARIKDSVQVTIQMNLEKGMDLKEVSVYAPGNPQQIFGDSVLSVADFEVLQNGELLLLVYPKRLTKGSELLLWDDGKIRSQLVVAGTAEELVRDYRGNSHLICKEKVCGIQIKDNVISASRLEKEYFSRYLSPILDSNKSILYFSDYNKDYPSFSYYSVDRLDSVYVKIREITDDFMMELYRSEYKWVDVRTKLWAKTKELETGIAAEIWVGANYFTQSVYYKSLYAPMFHRNDTLFVFDYYKDKLLRFDANGEQLDSIPIFHHYQAKQTGWNKKLIQDPVSGQVFALFDVAGYSFLRWINCETGELGEKIALKYRYVEKIEIHNNEVYYIYRPFESPQKKYLYKEKLPYKFQKSKVPKGDAISSE